MDARKAGSASDTTRQIPRPPVLMGRLAWIHWGVGDGKVSNRANATSQQAVKLFQSLIADVWQAAKHAYYLWCTEG